MCPYARFQSAMFDKDTLIIAYDERRGEPRKSLARASGLAAADCTDCTLCVQVCPVGIDIRDGLQYECIACAACVDACNGVMDRIGKPRALVRYTSERHDREGRFRILRGRALGYGLIWLALIGGFVALLVLRSPIELDVLRDRRQLFREMSDGRIVNLYTLKIGNKTGEAHAFRIAAYRADGRGIPLSTDSVELQASQTLPVVVAATLPADEARGAQTIRFEVTALDRAGLKRDHDSRFFGASP
jgi:cytochrome c oxidase accessory protein FixG